MYTAKLKNLCIHCPSVSYHISTGTLAIETAAFLTLRLLLSATFHIYLCFPQNVKVNFFFPPPNFDDGTAVPSTTYRDRRHWLPPHVALFSLLSD